MGGGQQAIMGGGQHFAGRQSPSARHPTTLKGSATTPATSWKAPLQIMANGFSWHLGGGQGGGQYIGGGHTEGPHMGGGHIGRGHGPPAKTWTAANATRSTVSVATRTTRFLLMRFSSKRERSASDRAVQPAKFAFHIRSSRYQKTGYPVN